jgi:protein FrlC
LDETIRRIARIGYDGIEILCAAPHAWPDYLSSARRKEIKTLLDGEGIKASSLLPAPGGGPGCNPASVLAEEREFAISQYCSVVDLAADLGADLVLYIAGWQIFGCTRRDAWNRSRDCLAAIARHATHRGIRIAVEPTPADSNLIETPDHAIELIVDVGEPNIRVMFDTFHAHYRNEVAADYVRRIGKDLVHVHASNPGCEAPEDGPIDWYGLIHALKETAFSGYVTMEVGFSSRSVQPDQIARRSLAFLRSVEAQVK